MFREMRRFKQQLSENECIDVLKNTKRGVLSVHGEDGYPYAFPMNYIFLDNKIYFHCAKEGHKLDAIKKDNKVSFCVMDKGFIKDGEWAYNVKSVIIFGKINIISDFDTAMNIGRAIAKKYFPPEESIEKEIAHSGSRVQILELSMEHMTGKLVKES